jgi:hypothetical protein
LINDEYDVRFKSDFESNNNAEEKQQSSNSVRSKLKIYKKYYMTCSFGRILKAFMKKKRKLCDREELS